MSKNVKRVMVGLSVGLNIFLGVSVMGLANTCLDYENRIATANKYLQEAEDEIGLVSGSCMFNYPYEEISKQALLTKDTINGIKHVINNTTGEDEYDTGLTDVRILVDNIKGEKCKFFGKVAKIVDVTDENGLVTDNIYIIYPRGAENRAIAVQMSVDKIAEDIQVDDFITVKGVSGGKYKISKDLTLPSMIADSYEIN